MTHHQLCRITFASAVALAASSVFAQGGASTPGPCGIPIPVVFAAGAADFIVSDGAVLEVSSGITYTTNAWGAPLQYELAFAANMAGPGDVIEINDTSANIEGASWGHAGSPNQSRVAWTDGSGNPIPVHDLTIIGGLTDRAQLVGRMTFGDDLGGYDSLRFENITIRNKSYASSPVLVYMNSVGGLLKFYECDFRPEDPTSTAWLGQGMKWGIRGHGVAQWDIRDCSFASAQEHCVYIDNCQGDSLFIRLEPEDILTETGRTFLQLTSRVSSGPAGYGDILVQDCVSSWVNAAAGGGSAYTFTGAPNGTICVSGCEARGTTGALVVYTETGLPPYYGTGGYATEKFVLEDFIADYSSGTRDIVKVTGVGEVRIGEFDIVTGSGSSNTHIVFNDLVYGGPIQNGSECLALPLVRVAMYPGFMGVGAKVKNFGVVLTNAQINVMKCP